MKSKSKSPVFNNLSGDIDIKSILDAANVIDHPKIDKKMPKFKPKPNCQSLAVVGDEGGDVENCQGLIDDDEPGLSADERTKKQKIRLDDDKMTKLYQSGMTTAEVADVMGYNYRSVWMWHLRNEAKLSSVSSFLGVRTQSIQLMQQQLATALNKLVDELMTRNLKGMKDNDLSSMIKTIEIVQDGYYRRERLELGKSTANSFVKIWQDVKDKSDEKIKQMYQDSTTIDAEFIDITKERESDAL